MRILAIALLLSACQSWQPPPPVVVTPPTGDCASACKNLRRLGCPNGEPTADGASCEAVCDNALHSPAPLPMACVAHATSCEQADRCER